MKFISNMEIIVYEIKKKIVEKNLKQDSAIKDNHMKQEKESKKNRRWTFNVNTGSASIYYFHNSSFNYLI